MVPSELRSSMGILNILVKDRRANESGGREKKGICWGLTYWKHGQPTASTTAFFWSWLSFAVLLKFHKYINATFHKKNQFFCKLQIIFPLHESALLAQTKTQQQKASSWVCPTIVILLLLKLDGRLPVHRLLDQAQHLLFAPLKFLLPHLNAVHPDHIRDSQSSDTEEHHHKALNIIRLHTELQRSDH